MSRLLPRGARCYDLVIGGRRRNIGLEVMTMDGTGEYYLACIAHDRMKETMIDCLGRHRDSLVDLPIIATGTTGRMIRERLGLAVKCMQSGPLGGDQQIGSKIACGKVGAVIFLRDPLFAHPHEPDIMAFLRLCDVHFIPLATNPATAELLLSNLPLIFGTRGGADAFRPAVDAVAAP